MGEFIAKVSVVDYQIEDNEQTSWVDSGFLGSGKIALFWYTEQGIVGLAESLEGDHAEDLGNFVGLSLGHFELWACFESHFDTDDMYYYPRGRVVYDKGVVGYRVVCDPKLARSSECREKIRQAFALDAETVFDTDLHYRSSFQSPELAEYTEEELVDPFCF